MNRMVRTLSVAACMAAIVCNARAGEIKPDLAIKMERAMLELTAQVKPEKPRKVLVYTRAAGFVHTSIPVGAKCFEMLGQKTGAFEVTKVTDDPAVFSDEALKEFDAIVLMSTTADFNLPKVPGKPKDFDKKTDAEKEKILEEIAAAQAAVKGAKEAEPARKKALLDFVSGGKGLVGIHAATDAYYKWPEFGEMIGGYFNGHPFSKIHIRIDDPKSPINAQFEGQSFDFSDEIYTFKPPYSREKLHVLLSIDLEKSNIKDDDKRHNRPDRDYAVAWIREWGKGRVFYTLLGHNEITFATPLSVKYFLAGTQYALGDLKADAKPSK